jgi:drug/metabolite transporter (DMT)-like permease
VAADPALAHGLVVLSYLAGGPAIGVSLALTAGAFAAAIRRERTLPAWLWWVSIVATVLGVATVTTMLAPANNSSAAYGVLLLGAVALFAWLVASSVVLLGRALRDENGHLDPQ